MKVIIVGASGTIGQRIVDVLAPHHQIVSVGHKSGDYQVDIASIDSIKAMYQEIGAFDALVSATGQVKFMMLEKMTEQDYWFGLQHKLMGQVNLVRIGLEFINTNGSFTLTSGILNRDPIKTSSSAAMVNGGLDGFVTAAAIEMPKSVRINCVSPTVITESMPIYEKFFPGFKPVSAAEAALAYRKSVDGWQTGQVYYV